MIASGEDPKDEHTPFTDQEIDELPDYLRDFVQGSKLQAADRGAHDDYDDEDEGFTDIYTR